jgi:hypothetical protein
MTDPTNRPLWQVMADAYIIAHASGNVAHAYAAELRAIAEAISNELATHIVGDDPVMEVVAWLLAEADKAEAAGVYEQARKRNHMRKNRGTTADS